MAGNASILVLLTLSALLLMPDLASRYRYVHIMQQGGADDRERLLEGLRDDNPNVYALEQLVQLEIAHGNFAGAALTLQTLDRLIPNYSISGYFKAASLLQQRRMGEARDAALEYQARDLYLPQTAYLLARLAVAENDATLLLQQLGLLITPLLVSQVGIADIDSRSVVMDSSQRESACLFYRAPDASMQFRLSINHEAMAAIMLGANTVFTASDALAASRYQAMIAGGVHGLACEGLTPAQQDAFRGALQTVLLHLSQAVGH